MRNKYILFIFIALSLTSCASYKSSKVERTEKSLQIAENTTELFLIGDAGKTENGKIPSALKSMQNQFSEADENDILLFLGDNVYQKGIPNEDDKTYGEAVLTINYQIEAAKKFPGKSYFIAGNHDWYHGLDGLKRQEEMVINALGKNTFLPKSGCPLDLIKTNDDLWIITVDSQWYITNWDKHPNINVNCGEINSREKFLTELSGMINKAQGKTLIIAIHHPLFTNGEHNGKFPARLLFPIDFLRKTTGLVNADLSHPHYRELANRISTMLQNTPNNAIIVSGHEHNLQYIEKNDIKQIISGGGSKETALKVPKTDFGFAGKGFAVLQLAENNQKVYYFDANGEQIHEQLIRDFEEKSDAKTTKIHLDSTKKASIYPKEIFERLPKNKTINGERYRKYYGIEYEFPVADLDTLYGGLKPVKLGGGFQSISLRLEDKNGKEYAMRRLRKSASQFIQKQVFPEDFYKNELEETISETIVYDFFTASYPFAFLTIGDLSDAVGIYHPNPTIFYVPKQPALDGFNEEIGDDLYMIEERPAKEWKDLESFGKPDDIISSDDAFQNILNDEDNKIDKENVIKTRLFDIWLNDWDRHSDQYRWAVYKKTKRKYTK